MMIKVLYISDNLRQRFGVTSVIMNYLEQITDKSIKIDLLVYKNSELEMIDRAKSFGADVFYMPELGLRNLGEFRKFIWSFFECHKYDIVHSHFNQIDSIVFPIARKNGVKYCISHSHNTKLSDNKLKAIRNRLMCWNISWNADVLAACSEKAGLALYGKRFTTSKKGLIIHNGVNINKYAFDSKKREIIRREFNIQDNEVLIGHIGSFKLQKNQQYLVRIFYELHKIDSRYRLLFVGDGETIENVKNMVSNLNLKEFVFFAGVRSDVDSILSALDIFVLPSLYEGLPVIGIEAQTAGLKCIFADTITQEVNLTNQVFLPLEDNVEKWVDAIVNSEYKHNVEYARVIEDKGYSIESESLKLKDRYFNLMVNN